MTNIYRVRVVLCWANEKEKNTLTSFGKTVRTGERLPFLKQNCRTFESKTYNSTTDPQLQFSSFDVKNVVLKFDMERIRQQTHGKGSCATTESNKKLQPNLEDWCALKNIRKYPKTSSISLSAKHKLGHPKRKSRRNNGNLMSSKTEAIRQNYANKKPTKQINPGITRQRLTNPTNTTDTAIKENGKLRNSKSWI